MEPKINQEVEAQQSLFTHNTELTLTVRLLVKPIFSV